MYTISTHLPTHECNVEATLQAETLKCKCSQNNMLSLTYHLCQGGLTKVALLVYSQTNKTSNLLNEENVSWYQLELGKELADISTLLPTHETSENTIH